MSKNTSQKINVLGGYIGLDGNVYPAENALKNTPQISEAEFIRQKRERQIADAFPKGFRRFRYLAPANALQPKPTRKGGE